MDGLTDEVDITSEDVDLANQFDDRDNLQQPLAITQGITNQNAVILISITCGTGQVVVTSTVWLPAAQTANSKMGEMLSNKNYKNFVAL